MLRAGPGTESPPQVHQHMRTEDHLGDRHLLLPTEWVSGDQRREEGGLCGTAHPPSPRAFPELRLPRELPQGLRPRPRWAPAEGRPAIGANTHPSSYASVERGL